MRTFKTLIATAFAGLLLVGPVMAKSPDAPAMTKAAPAMKADAKAPLLDINSASKADLQAMKGIGDKRADDIIKGRPYKGKDDLVQKKILPQGVYDGIKDKIIAKQK